MSACHACGNTSATHRCSACCLVTYCNNDKCHRTGWLEGTHHLFCIAQFGGKFPEQYEAKYGSQPPLDLTVLQNSLLYFRHVYV